MPHSVVRFIVREKSIGICKCVCVCSYYNVFFGVSGLTLRVVGGGS